MRGCVHYFVILALSVLASARGSYADALPKSLNPQVQRIVAEISTTHIADIQKKLESFGTRNIYSADDDPNHGVGAAREWIAGQFKSYSPNLQVSFDKHKLAKQGRAFRNVEIWNVVAVLPGTTEPERQVLVTAHYDSIHLMYKENSGKTGPREVDPDGTAAAPAPGVTDDGSGTAAVMELARVMSQYKFRKTIVFVTFAAEEYGLLGSSLFAEAAQARHDQIEAVFNNDIIGSDTRGNGVTTDHYVNVYSPDPDDSGARQLARYMKDIGERYVPGFNINLVFRHDRFGRGGDHSPFNAAGFAAIRVTTPSENFSNQHTGNDTFANTAPAYTTLVAKANAASVATLALAPKTPVISSPSIGEGRAYANPLERGTGYDALLRWQNPNLEPDLASYVVVMRQTTSPYWEKETAVGNVTEYTLPNVNIDEVVLGVKAIDKAGNESLVAAYVSPPYQAHKVATY